MSISSGLYWAVVLGRIGPSTHNLGVDPGVYAPPSTWTILTLLRELRFLFFGGGGAGA